MISTIKVKFKLDLGPQKLLPYSIAYRIKFKLLTLVFKAFTITHLQTHLAPLFPRTLENSSHFELLNTFQCSSIFSLLHFCDFNYPVLSNCTFFFPSLFIYLLAFAHCINVELHGNALSPYLFSSVFHWFFLSPIFPIYVKGHYFWTILSSQL